MAQVVDASAHIFSGDRTRYPIAARLGGVLPAWAKGRQALTAEELLGLMADAGVNQAILVHQPNIYDTDHSYLLDTARRYPESFVVQGAIEVYYRYAAQMAGLLRGAGAAGGRRRYIQGRTRSGAGCGRLDRLGPDEASVGRGGEWLDSRLAALGADAAHSSSSACDRAFPHRAHGASPIFGSPDGGWPAVRRREGLLRPRRISQRVSRLFAGQHPGSREGQIHARGVFRQAD